MNSSIYNCGWAKTRLVKETNGDEKTIARWKRTGHRFRCPKSFPPVLVVSSASAPNQVPLYDFKSWRHKTASDALHVTMVTDRHAVHPRSCSELGGSHFPLSELNKGVLWTFFLAVHNTPLLNELIMVDLHVVCRQIKKKRTQLNSELQHPLAKLKRSAGHCMPYMTKSSGLCRSTLDTRP